MGTKHLIWVVLLFGAVGLAISCSDDNNGVGPQPKDTALYVDEAILIDTTAAIHISGEEVDRLIFNLDNVPMFQSGGFDDIYIFYGTPYEVDEENLVFNFKRQGWNILVTDPGPVIGLMSGGFGHMASKMGLPVSEFVSDSLRLYIRPWYLPMPGAKGNLPLPTHTVRGVQLNDHYSPLYIPNSDHVHFSGIGFDGQNYRLVVRTEYNWKLWKLSAAGEIVGQADCPATYPNDMTLGGNDIWITDAQYGSPDSTSRIWRLDYVGDSRCTFSFPSSNIGGITYDNGEIWLSENTPQDHRIFQIDANASCSTGVAVILDTIDIGKPIKSLAWDGTNLLAASDSLYVVSTEGTIINAYAWTVGGEQRIDYYNGYLHVFCSGSAGLNLDDRVIVKLKMR